MQLILIQSREDKAVYADEWLRQSYVAVNQIVLAGI